MNPVSTASSRKTSLNPNAREFVPTSFRSNSFVTISTTGDETEPSTTSDNGKTFSDKTNSSDTCASDEESRRYWNAQLPDDLILDTDFIPTAEEDNDGPRASALRASATESSGLEEAVEFVGDTLPWERSVHNGKQPYGAAHVTAYDFSNANSNGLASSRQLWENDHASPQFNGNWNGQLSSGGNGPIYPSALSQSALKESDSFDALSLLANEFPNIPVQKLADVYQANSGNLSSTVLVLTQLKLQDEGNQWHSLLSPYRFSPNSRPLDFSAPSRPDLACGLSHFLEDTDLQHHADFHRLSRKSSSQWPYERNGPAPEVSLGPSSFLPMNSYSGLFEGDSSSAANDERFELPHMHHKHRLSPQSWMETDDALVNLMADLREEAQNHCRIQNAYFEQARQTCFVGNRGLAKEASAKGQVLNRSMKASQNKAAEIDFQRNMSSMQSSFGPGQTQLLDLRGRHVNEAINLLRCELSALRVASRSSRQRQQVFISVGTGHQKGTRTLARLLFAVKWYLTEEECLNFTEPQPGILKVVVS